MKRRSPERRRTGDETKTFGGRGGAGSGREEANPQDITTDNLLAKLGWNYAGNDRLQLSYERYQDDIDTRVLSEASTLTSTSLGGGMFSNALTAASNATDSTDRERISLEHQRELNTAFADQLKWQLNHQDSKIRQQTEHNRYSWVAFNRNPTPPASAFERLRTRDSIYEEKLWSVNGQLDKHFAVGDTQHHLIRTQRQVALD